MLEVHQAIQTKHLNRSDRDDSGTRGYLRVMLYRLDEACNDLE